MGARATALLIAHSVRTDANLYPIRIGILIVAYNAEATIVRVLERIPSRTWDDVDEVAVFDDASNDETSKAAVSFEKAGGRGKLTVIRHGENLGYGGNQKAGYYYFLQKGFDVVVLLHGDGQYAPELLADLYAPIIRGEGDAVFGTRITSKYGGALKGGMPIYKYVGNRVLTAISNRLLGMHLSEFHSGYRAYKLAALRQIHLDSMTSDFHFDTEIIIKLKHQGFHILEIPIPTSYGDEKSHVIGYRYAAHVIFALIRYHSTKRGHKSFAEFAEYAKR